ncbi:uncharacterized protein LOC116340195 [Contarinia nasturtii]|uniref:uncharacterized protein LOC116340195 n=1 Tax=Contarinia nasturtii TaxID=265458 RepID=UPI0012D4795D|nr:uncharacterized protein LOC116340195 [Contarinia nasturtii]
MLFIRSFLVLALIILVAVILPIDGGNIPELTDLIEKAEAAEKVLQRNIQLRHEIEEIISEAKSIADIVETATSSDPSTSRSKERHGSGNDDVDNLIDQWQTGNLQLAVHKQRINKINKNLRDMKQEMNKITKDFTPEAKEIVGKLEAALAKFHSLPVMGFTQGPLKNIDPKFISHLGKNKGQSSKKKGSNK